MKTKLLFIFSFLSYGLFAQTSTGDIVITEIMNNPSPVSDTTGEWFEVYNSTANSININGWVVKDDGTNIHTIDGTIGGSTLIPAGEYFVLGRTSDTSTNGGALVDYQFHPSLRKDRSLLYEWGPFRINERGPSPMKGMPFPQDKKKLHHMC